MKLCIHRGTKQIGGTCIEVESQGKRIALDVGLPLDADSDQNTLPLLPKVSGFCQPDDTLLGVVISHPHMDHYGLAPHLRPDLPVYIGERANKILEAASRYVPNGIFFKKAIYYEAWKPTTIGPFTITPFLNDHSAFDAYSLLIEADGKRLFYSGDFRGHGRKKRVFERLLERPPKDIDVLMMEGTNISAEGQEKETPTETELEQRFVDDIEQTRGIYLAYTSAQNIDRVVTLYRAAKRTSRKLLVDLYTAVVLKAADTGGVPQSYWDGVSLYVPHRQRIQIKKNELFDDLTRHAKNRVFIESLSDASEKYVMILRPWMREDLDYAKCTEGARFAYSMWRGYLAEDYLKELTVWLKARGIPMTHIHTSGHAPVSDLQRFAQALAPKKLVPIHSFDTGRFEDYFENVEQKEDGQWWTV